MNLGRTVFSQLIEHLPSKEFQKCVSLLPRRFLSEKFLLLGSVSCDGIRPADLSGKPPRHRDVPAFDARQTLPMGFRGRVARSTLDANESRDRIYADFAQVLIGMARPICPRPDRCGLGPDSVRSRLDNNRPLPVAVSVGEIPQAKVRREDAHAAGSARQYSHVHPHYWRQSARHQHPRRDRPGGRRVLRHGSGLRRFRHASSCSALCSSFFVVRTKKNILLLLASRRQIHGLALGS